MTPQLIPFEERLIGSATINAVDARDLHRFLGVRKDYSEWIKAQIARADLLENEDYLILPQKGERENQGLTRIDYYLSFDACKHICMMSRSPKGKEARRYFIECERIALASQPATIALPPPSQREQIETYELAMDLIDRLGGLTDRDKLMFQDCIRNVTFSGQKLLPQHATSYGFSVAERVAHLGYRLDRRQQASFYPVLGKRLAAEYRSRHGVEPEKEMRYIDGATRKVGWYPQDCADWVDAIIQSFMASLDIFASKGA